MAQYNRSRFDPSIPTPRTSRFRRRRHLRDGSPDSSVERQQWRDDYPMVRNLLYEALDSSDSDLSLPTSHMSQGSDNSASSSASCDEVVIDNAVSDASSNNGNLPPDVAIGVANGSDSSGSTDERRPDDVRNQLLSEQEDEYASEDDYLEYQPILEPALDADVPDDRLQDLLNDEEAHEILDAQVNVTKAEILLAVLKFSLVYALPQTAIADLFKMLNVFLNTSVLPQSRYLVDKLFNFEGNVNYYALCPNCKNFVTEFHRGQDQNARCIPCDLEFSLTDPTYRDFFCTINPENEIVNLLDDNWSYYESVAEARTEETDDINDFHSGLLYKQLRNSLPEHKKNNFITATFNSDGSPIFESSAFSIWPIQIIINELPFKIRTTKSIVCGLWFGRNKPNMNIFLEPFVRQMNLFSTDGITCTIGDTFRTIYVYAICSCVDSVARAPMQGVTQFNGYYGCNWCLHPGYYIAVGRGGSIKYILLDEPTQERNEADTLRDARQATATGQPVNGVMKESILFLLLHFNIVYGFVVDPMHCIDEGIVKQFLKYWFDTSNMPYSLTQAEIDIIDNVLKIITVPSKLMRNSRSIRDRKFWKAKELQNWALYYSTVALAMIPRMRDYALHWSYLVRAYYILLQSNITREEIAEAHRLLTMFVALTELYYSRSAMTFNVHQLLHTAQSVVNWGSLYYHSGYGFENGNGQIVEQVQAAKGVVFQVCRVLGMNRSERILTKFMLQNDPYSEILAYIRYLETRECTKVLKTNNGRYFGPFSRPTPLWIRQLNLSISAIVYHKLVKMESVYLSCNKLRLRTNNSFAKTSDNNYVQIVFFIVDRLNRQEYTVCRNVNVMNIFEHDNNLQQFQIKRITGIDPQLIAINTNSLEKICVYMNCNDQQYLCSVPNIYSY